METLITPQTAAKQLGISPSTFKRFCDTHNVPLVRTPGGHRRIETCQLEIVSRLMRSRSESQAPAPSINDAVAMLLAGEHKELSERFWSASQTVGPLTQLLEDVLVPALWKVGDLWLGKQISTANEKVCTTTAGLVIDSLIGRFPSPTESPRIFIGASFPPSLDTLASKFIAFSLLSIGVRGIQLGCSIAPEIIAHAAEQYSAEAVWISHTHIINLEQVVADHAALSRMLPKDTRVIIGGGGLAPSVRRALPTCVYYESIELWLASEKAMNKLP